MFAEIFTERWNGFIEEMSKILDYEKRLAIYVASMIHQCLESFESFHTHNYTAVQTLTYFCSLYFKLLIPWLCKIFHIIESFLVGVLSYNGVISCMLSCLGSKGGRDSKKKCRLKRYRCHITWGKYR